MKRCMRLVSGLKEEEKRKREKIEQEKDFAELLHKPKFPSDDDSATCWDSEFMEDIEEPSDMHHVENYPEWSPPEVLSEGVLGYTDSFVKRTNRDSDEEMWRCSDDDESDDIYEKAQNAAKLEKLEVDEYYKKVFSKKLPNLKAPKHVKLTKFFTTMKNKYCHRYKCVNVNGDQVHLFQMYCGCVLRAESLRSKADVAKHILHACPFSKTSEINDRIPFCRIFFISKNISGSPGRSFLDTLSSESVPREKRIGKGKRTDHLDCARRKFCVYNTDSYWQTFFFQANSHISFRESFFEGEHVFWECEQDEWVVVESVVVKMLWPEGDVTIERSGGGEKRTGYYSLVRKYKHNEPRANEFVHPGSYTTTPLVRLCDSNGVSNLDDPGGCVEYAVYNADVFSLWAHRRVVERDTAEKLHDGLSRLPIFETDTLYVDSFSSKLLTSDLPTQHIYWVLDTTAGHERHELGKVIKYDEKQSRRSQEEKNIQYVTSMLITQFTKKSEKLLKSVGVSKLVDDVVRIELKYKDFSVITKPLFVWNEEIARGLGFRPENAQTIGDYGDALNPGRFDKEYDYRFFGLFDMDKERLGLNPYCVAPHRTRSILTKDENFVATMKKVSFTWLQKLCTDFAELNDELTNKYIIRAVAYQRRMILKGRFEEIPRIRVCFRKNFYNEYPFMAGVVYVKCDSMKCDYEEFYIFFLPPSMRFFNFDRTVIHDYCGDNFCDATVGKNLTSIVKKKAAKIFRTETMRPTCTRCSDLCNKGVLGGHRMCHLQGRKICPSPQFHHNEDLFSFLSVSEFKDVHVNNVFGDVFEVTYVCDQELAEVCPPQHKEWMPEMWSKWEREQVKPFVLTLTNCPVLYESSKVPSYEAEMTMTVCRSSFDGRWHRVGYRPFSAQYRVSCPGPTLPSVADMEFGLPNPPERIRLCHKKLRYSRVATGTKRSIECAEDDDEFEERIHGMSKEERRGEATILTGGNATQTGPRTNFLHLI